MPSTRESVAIADLAIYPLILVLTIVVIIRNGHRRKQGWIYLSIFCVIRICGAIFQVLHEKHPESISDTEWAMILQSVGLSPLILASLGLLNGVVEAISENQDLASSESNGGKIQAFLSKTKGLGNFTLGVTKSRRALVIRLLHLPCIGGLVLCIIGGIDEASTNVSKHSSGHSLFKAGILIFTATFILLGILIMVTLLELRKAPSDQKRILIALVVALPLLFVRLLWSILSVFTNSDNFNIRGGKAGIQIGMAILEEFLIVVAYVVVGLAMGFKSN